MGHARTAVAGLTGSASSCQQLFCDPREGCAAQIAVLRETEGQGPYCSLVMAVVVVKDVLVFVAFAANLEVASSVPGPHPHQHTPTKTRTRTSFRVWIAGGSASRTFFRTNSAHYPGTTGEFCCDIKWVSVI